jgi:hypothetical protein
MRRKIKVIEPIPLSTNSKGVRINSLLSNGKTRYYSQTHNTYQFYKKRNGKFIKSGPEVPIGWYHKYLIQEYPHNKTLANPRWFLAVDFFKNITPEEWDLFKLSYKLENINEQLE